jgi:ribosomal subunit interface protein
MQDMVINIHTKDIKLTNQLKDYIEAKIKKLCTFSSRICDESTEIKVEVHEQARHTYQPNFEVQVTMYVPHSIIRAEDTGTIIEEAVDKVEEKLKKQIERYKAKLTHRDKKGKWVQYAPEAKPTEETDFEVPKIIRRKRISKFLPMYEQEAIEQMELLGHDFFLFQNVDTKRVSLIYKRKDGYYGIIEPKTEEDFGYIKT